MARGEATVWQMGRFFRRAGATLSMLLFLGAGMAAEVETARKQFISGEYSNCISTCRQAISEHSYQEEWRELLVKSLFTTGAYEEAGLALSNALERFSWSVPLRVLGHEVFRYTSQSNRAAPMLDQVEALVSTRNPWAMRDPATLVAVGRAALLLGADARRVLDNLFEQARKMNPQFREVYLALGELALEKHDYQLASKHFADGLKKFPDDPDMNGGLARAFQPSNRRQMIAHINATLEANTNHTTALLLLAEHLIDGEEYEGADEMIERVLSVNRWHPDAWAYRAVLRHLRNERPEEAAARENALKFWAANPRVDHLIGRKLSQKYRFAEGASFQRKALAFAGNYVPAQAQLAQDLLRLGEETEGWRLAEQAHQRDEYDVTTFNLVTLRGKLTKFRTLTNAHFIVRMATNEAAIYGEEVLDLLGRAKSALLPKYGLELARPTTVEIYPEQKDFGVRTFGMPDNPGYLGVCFGPVITANSPASQGAQPANWQAVLWHEFAHVVTLQMTGNKMPRWLSEGISVFEELEANPTWGQRMTAHYREMILGEDLTPVSELSSAFLAPKTPLHLQFAYYESALVVEFIVKRFGFDALTRILRDLGNDVEINQAIAAHTIEMEKLEEEFSAFARDRATRLGPGLDWAKPNPAELRSTNWITANPTNYWALQRQAADLMRQNNWKEATRPLEMLVRLHPIQTGPDSAYRLLAHAYRSLNDTNAERAVLMAMAARDADAIDAFARLAELGAATADWKVVQENAARHLAVNPLVPEPHRHAALANEALGDDKAAIRAWRVLLLLDPPDPADVHFRLGRLLHKTGDAAARRHVLQALEEAPRFRDAHRLLRELRQGELRVDAAPKTTEPSADFE